MIGCKLICKLHCKLEMRRDGCTKISEFIIISDSLNQTRDRRLFIKRFNDYMEFLPAYKVAEICIQAQKQLSKADFQYMLDALWKIVAISQEG